jgi:hypothetical protein
MPSALRCVRGLKRVHAKYTIIKGIFLRVLLGFGVRFSVIGRRLRSSVIGCHRISLLSDILLLVVTFVLLLLVPVAVVLLSVLLLLVVIFVLL